MRCSRCGETAVVQRDGGYFCGRCALTRDWEEIVRLVQQMNGPRGKPKSSGSAAPPAAAAADAGTALPPADPFS